MSYQNSKEQQLIHELNNALAISDGFIRNFEKRFKDDQMKSKDEELIKLGKALQGLQRSIVCVKELRQLVKEKLDSENLED